MSKTYTEPVTVLYGHMQMILAALDAAYGYHMADDLASQYKNVGGTHRPSHLTKRLEKALWTVEGYLAEGADELPDE